MLKLEKTPQLLAISLRERERFFEPRLLKALTIALILHAGALLFFHVTPFTFSSNFVYPPIKVQTEKPMDGKTSAIISSYAAEPEEISLPPISLIPTIDWISFPQESILMPDLELVNLDALQSLEERYWPSWEEPLSLPLEEQKIKLAISGDLANLPVVSSDPLLKQMHPISEHSSPSYVTYHVQLDEQTGELFWYEKIQSSGIASIDRLTEKILLNLRFSLPESNETVKGTLDFIVLSVEE